MSDKPQAKYAIASSTGPACLGWIRRAMRRRPVLFRTLPSARRLGVFAALAFTAISAITMAPAGADPGTTIPDPGSRPTAAGGLTVPNQGGTDQPVSLPQAPVLGPLAMQIITAENTVEGTGENLKRADDLVEAAQLATDQSAERLRTAQAEVDRLRGREQSAAAEAFKWANELGPFDEYASELHDLSRIAPGIVDRPGSQALARELLRAEDEVRAAAAAYQTSDAVARSSASSRDTLKAQFDQQSAALATLKANNAAELTKIEAERDAFEQSLGSSTLGEINADGMTSNPKALSAVRYALLQADKKIPYLWGAEGPKAFDCSGLMLAAYRSVGVTLPRVAADQYHHGPTVTSTRSARGDLLVPGDMVFFSYNLNDWTQIHHVGMYIGAGRMVEAPSLGETVKISVVHWSDFFGAVRVFPAVPAPKPSTPTTQPATSKPGASTTSKVPSSQPGQSSTSSTEPSKSQTPTQTSTSTSSGTTEASASASSSSSS